MNELRDWLFDTGPIQAVQQFFGLGHPLPFTVLSMLGDTWGMVFVVGLAFWLFGRRTMYALVAIVVVGAATKVLLTALFAVPRPDGQEIVVYAHLEVGSFPSGHVYEAVGPWGLLYAYRCVPLWVPALVALLVGLGRLYLGAHYLADVIAAIGFGVILVWLHVRLWPAARAWLARRWWRFHLALAGVAVAGTLVWMHMVGPHPRRYEVFGMILGAAVGLPLEFRLLRYEPRARSWTGRAGMVLVGLLGIVAFVLWDRSRPESALLLGTLTAGLATLWVLLGAPALLVALGLGERAPPAPGGVSASSTTHRAERERA